MKRRRNLIQSRSPKQRPHARVRPSNNCDGYKFLFYIFLVFAIIFFITLSVNEFNLHKESTSQQILALEKELRDAELDRFCEMQRLENKISPPSPKTEAKIARIRVALFNAQISNHQNFLSKTGKTICEAWDRIGDSIVLSIGIFLGISGVILFLFCLLVPTDEESDPPITSAIKTGLVVGGGYLAYRALKGAAKGLNEAVPDKAKTVLAAGAATAIAAKAVKK